MLDFFKNNSMELVNLHDQSSLLWLAMHEMTWEEYKPLVNMCVARKLSRALTAFSVAIFAKTRDDCHPESLYTRQAALQMDSFELFFEARRCFGEDASPYLRAGDYAC